jgi:hypothetical protein
MFAVEWGTRLFGHGTPISAGRKQAGVAPN